MGCPGDKIRSKGKGKGLGIGKGKGPIGRMQMEESEFGKEYRKGAAIIHKAAIDNKVPIVK